MHLHEHHQQPYAPMHIQWEFIGTLIRTSPTTLHQRHHLAWVKFCMVQPNFYMHPSCFFNLNLHVRMEFHSYE